MLFSISTKLGSIRELKKIKNIKSKTSKNRSYYRSNTSSSDSDSDSYLSSESEGDRKRQPTERKEISDLDNVMTDSKKKNNNQHNDAIGYETKFDSKFSLSSGTQDPLRVVTVSLRGCKKQRASIIDCLKYLLGSIATNSMIKRKHTKPYERKMRSNNLEYSTSTGPYCTTHDINVPFFMLEFSISKIILHQFHVDNNEGELGVGYDMIIGRDLMVQLGLSANFKNEVLQWDGITVPMK